MTLTFTALCRGGRLSGGALSWETPEDIAPFETGSPFFGLAAPDEVISGNPPSASPVLRRESQRKLGRVLRTGRRS